MAMAVEKFVDGLGTNKIRFAFQLFARKIGLDILPVILNLPLCWSVAVRRSTATFLLIAGPRYVQLFTAGAPLSGFFPRNAQSSGGLWVETLVESP